MWTVKTQEDINRIENSDALVGVFLDRGYHRERMEWLFQAKDGFDEHARNAWHLLIPVNKGNEYAVDTPAGPDRYNVALAAAFIDRLEIPFADLPCIAFRARGDDCFFLKLGGRNRDSFIEEIGRIADLARQCQRESTLKGAAFRDYVNMQVANHLRRRRLLSAARSALPAISGFLGAAVDASELV
jgi:hypothetical protein